MTSTKKTYVPMYSPQFYATCAVGGSFSCGLTHAFVTPLDLVKCRLQVNPTLYRGILNGWSTILRAEGVPGITVGWFPTFWGYSMQGACKFGFYELFKKKYADWAGEENAYKYRTSLYLAASASAEFIADIALCPLEAVKVRMQTAAIPFANSTGEAIKKISTMEGISGFYKGLAPLWMRQIPYTMMKFACFELTVESIYKYALSRPKSDYSKGEQLAVSFVGGYIAGVFCAVVSHPADTVVSKLNNLKSATSESTGQAIRHILRDLGFLGVWRGLMPRIVMIGTLTGLQWFIYDTYKVWSGLPTTGATPEAKKSGSTNISFPVSAGKSTNY
jgi:solute carrier family 25 phosphate transporter 3